MALLSTGELNNVLASPSPQLGGLTALRLYLPSSQICPYQELIPFCVTLSAESEFALEPFADYRPLLPASFLPLAPMPSALYAPVPCRSVQTQLSTRRASSAPHTTREA